MNLDHSVWKMCFGGVHITVVNVVQVLRGKVPENCQDFLSSQTDSETYLKQIVYTSEVPSSIATFKATIQPNPPKLVRHFCAG